MALETTTNTGKNQKFSRKWREQSSRPFNPQAVL